MSTLVKQVRSEKKKRQMVLLTIIVLSMLYFSISLVFGDMGLFKYIELNRTRKNLEKQITDIHKQNEQLRVQLKALKEDPFYKEKIAREEYGLSRSDEYIFQYDR
jgi:cell division protein FtsB